jgi:Rrf2 family protein
MLGRGRSVKRRNLGYGRWRSRPLRTAVPCRPRLGENASMHVSAKADYAVRAAAELAAAGPGPVKGDRIAEAQQIPLKFLENILSDLRHAGYVQSQRGAEGGYWLARPADQVTLADIIRVVDGPLANVRGARPESVTYGGTASHLLEVWIAVRVSLRSVLEQVTLADLVAGTLPAEVRALTEDPDAWVSRSVAGQAPPPRRPASPAGERSTGRR